MQYFCFYRAACGVVMVIWPVTSTWLQEILCSLYMLLIIDCLVSDYQTVTWLVYKIPIPQYLFSELILDQPSCIWTWYFNWNFLQDGCWACVLASSEIFEDGVCSSNQQSPDCHRQHWLVSSLLMIYHLSSDFTRCKSWLIMVERKILPTVKVQWIVMMLLSRKLLTL